MWQEEMERARVYRVGAGARPYQRTNFVPSTVSRQVDERLHARGLSTSSNSSWTFSNGQLDQHKGARTGLCGAVLLAAIFIVVAAVACVGGLAFYMGAKRVDTANTNLVLDGNLRITYGDQFKADLLDASSQLFLEKAERYQQMIRVVLQKSPVQAALKDVAVMRFMNGSNLHIGFRVHLDRRKLAEGVNALDAIRSALNEEFSSVKPAAFRNMQVDLHRLVHNKGEADSAYEDSRLETDSHKDRRKEIVSKSTTESIVSHKPKPNLTPVKGTVQLTDLGESIKLKNPGTTEKRDEIKFVEFKKETEPLDDVEIEKEIVQVAQEATLLPSSSSSVVTFTTTTTSTTTTTERATTSKGVTAKPSKVYQSIYITSENVRISNGSSNTNGPTASLKVSKPVSNAQSPAQPTSFGGSYKVTKTDSTLQSDNVFNNPAEDDIVRSEVKEHERLRKDDVHPVAKQNVNLRSEIRDESTRARTTSSTTERSTGQIVRATTWFSSSVNGHARPLLSEHQVPQPVNVGFALTGASDDGWRPIIPTRSPRIPISSSTTTERFVDEYDSLVLKERTHPEIEPDIDAPITFSKKVYEANLRVPQVTEDKKQAKPTNTKLSKITEEIAKKYKEIMKHQVPTEPANHQPAKEVPVTSPAQSSSTVPPAPPTVVTNPFKEADRSSSVLSFGLPELPILQQFHHLDSLLKSFAGGTAAGGSPGNFVMPPSSSTSRPVMSTTPIPQKSTLSSTTTTSTTTQSTTTATVTSSTTNEIESTTKQPVTTSTLTSTSKPKPTTTRRTTTRRTFEVTKRNNLLTTSRNEPLSTRFPMRRKPPVRNDTVYVAVSTFSPKFRLETENPDKATFTERPSTTSTSTTTTEKILTTTVTSTTNDSVNLPFVVKGEVEVLDQVSGETMTTEVPKLVTLLPVRSNVNMRSPLRPRPPSRKARNEPHRFVDDEDGGRWIYYSSSKMTSPPEKLFIVTPEPAAKEAPSDLPIYDTIEKLLNADFRTRQPTTSSTSDIVQRIVQQMDNVAIASENSSSVIVKINNTVLRKTALPKEIEQNPQVVNPVMSTKAVSGESSYKINNAGVPVLTKVLRKDPTIPGKNGDGGQSTEKTNADGPIRDLSFSRPSSASSGNVLNEAVSSHIHPTECMNSSVRCGNGVCLPASSRCNQLVDCADASDEKNCTCAEHLKAQRLNRKLCDGVADCWDFSDELNCDWCKPNQFLCSNSRSCIDTEKVCDGVVQCPHGDDERACVRVAPSLDAPGENYHSSGFLMVRKHGVWGKLCVDDFDAVSRQSNTGWQLSDLGRSVCKALTYRDFDKVERVYSVPNEARSLTSERESYFELGLRGASGEAQGRDSSLTFHGSTCAGKQVAKVTCRDLECGVRPQVTTLSSRIVGGGNASPGAWPWQAALYREGEFQCGATLVSSTWLISAGHCFYHNQEELWVARLGALRTSSTLPSPHEQIRSVAQIVVHPQYVDSGFLNDIALLRLAEPVRLTDHVRPICLPQPAATVADGAVCTVVGWGQLFELGRVFPDTLQEVQVPVISSAECRKRTVFLPLYKVTDDMLCAGYERGGRDACLGDSGGPLMCQEKDGRFTLYGVTSNGYGCARSNRPGVYTKVSRYLTWVQARINADVSNATGSRERADKCKGHRCPLGECLPRSRLCNGYVECSDGSDEKDCW